MARPIKQGIEYFPLDVGFLRDIKVRKIMKACGVSAPTVLLCLVGYIYKDCGYFLCWDEDVGFLVADEVGVSEALVSEVLQQALRVDFFNQKLFDEHKVITSTGVQNRYFKIVHDAKRTRVDIITEFCLLPSNEGVLADKKFVFTCKNGVNSVKTGVNSLENSQRKEKESTEKEKKNIIVGTNVPTPPALKKTKKSTKVFDHKSMEYQSTKFLANKILEKDPKTRKVPQTEEELQKWCVHIDYILRLDGRSVDELRKVLSFATKDPFWSTNILSTAKLREKFDTLLLQLGGKDGKATNAESSRYSEQTSYNPREMSRFKKASDMFGDKGSKFPHSDE